MQLPFNKMLAVHPKQTKKFNFLNFKKFQIKKHSTKQTHKTKQNKHTKRTNKKKEETKQRKEKKS